MAGVAEGAYILAVSGSPGVCKNAWGEILVYQPGSRHRLCTLLALMPRLNEYLE
jgi:molybdenum cofactor biosynthesis protein B